MTSKIKINLQYRNLPIEFNPVSIKARFYLNQINLLLKEKEKEQKDKINAQKSKEEKNILDDSFKENININIKKIPKMRKTQSLFFPSEKYFKKLKDYQKLNKNKLIKEKGFNTYIKKMIPCGNLIKNLKKTITEKSGVLHNIYIIPKNKDKSNIYYKRDISSACFPKKRKFFHKIENKTKNNDIIKIKKEKRIMSAPRIKYIDKNKEWIKKNKFIPEVNYKFFLDRPMEPMTRDRSVKALPFGGGILYCNSIWRTKKINDLIPNLHLKPLKKINDYKKKRSDIIYKRNYSLPHDFTFLSNRLIVDEDFYVY